MQNNINKYQPEQLSLWDRWFNRYKKVPIERGNESWSHYNYGYYIFSYNRDFVVYDVVDRLTGSFTIKKEYLN